MKFIKREDFRPATHLKDRPPMIQKNIIADEMDDKSSNEEYDVYDEDSNARQELYHISHNRESKLSTSKNAAMA